MTPTVKKLLIAAGALVAAGAVLLGTALALGLGGGRKLSTVGYYTETYDITEDFSDITAETAGCDISIEPSRDGRCTVVCRQEERSACRVEVSGKTLSIRRAEKSGAWYERVNIMTGEPGEKITVYLPEKDYGVLTISGGSSDAAVQPGVRLTDADISLRSGDIQLRGEISGSVKLQTDSGDIEAFGISPEVLSAETSSGDIDIEGLTVSGGIYLEASSGEIELDNTVCDTLTAAASSGSVSLEKTSAYGSVSVTTSSGDVLLDEADAGEIVIKTGSGSVTGRLLTDKSFFVSTSSGSVDVPRTVSEEKCSITTTSGDIRFAAPGSR